MKENWDMTMLTDFYEFTMSNGYLEEGLADTIAYFDLFFRKNPDQGGFSIAAGLESIIDYLLNLKFCEEDISYLRGKGIFSEKFLNYLKDFRFTCDVWAIPEGTPVFPGEPVLTVRGPIIEAQLIETFLLLTFNHQSLIATKANRIVRAAKGRSVMEFGSRRAHGASAAVLGARAAYIGGASGTACVKAEKDYQVPAMGTMGHSWIQSFDSELESFRAYAKQYPQNCSFLVDTYHVLKSGVPNAIRVFQEFKPRNMSIRIDSGDITYLSIAARKMLDDAGFEDCKIIASNSLDEYLIRDMLLQNACIDSFGVGEKLITAKSDPVFGGVYKLAAIEKNGEVIPRIKISENVEKITNPGFKKTLRFYDNRTGKALADVMMLMDESIDENQPYVIFDPKHIWKKKEIQNYRIRVLGEKIFDKGKLVYKRKTASEIREDCKREIDTLWEELLRFENPHEYYVDLSPEIWAMKYNLIDSFNHRV